MTAAGLPGIRTWYPPGETALATALPEGTGRLLARSPFGPAASFPVRDGQAVAGPLQPGTWAIEAWSESGELLAEELTTVGLPGDRPVPGFACTYDPDAVEPVLSWLRALRCTTVQFYDWMETYVEPLARSDDYADRLGRKHSLAAIRALTAGCRALGAIPQAYAPVYGADPEFGYRHPGLLLYRGDGEPERLGDLVQIADPANRDWQRHWLGAYGAAVDALGFGGCHLDTYGYPRAPLDEAGRQVPMAVAYSAFLDVVRRARPDDVLSFNQVNGVPPDFGLAGTPAYRYIEVWPPNDRWRHLEGLLQRSAAPGTPRDGVLALYPPVWSGAGSDHDARAALRTVVLSEAVATTLGCGLLVYGDDRGCLRDPYYPNYQPLTGVQAELVLAWHRFALRCRDLFADGADTSWTDIGDENGAVSVHWDGEVSQEPAGQAVYARVVRHEDCIAVSVLDLTGSETGSWRNGTGPGHCRSVTVTVLLDIPARWRAEVAVLGLDGDRFSPAAAGQRTHREGLAIEVEVPVALGWSVLRLRRR
jgi:dextranase